MNELPSGGAAEIWASTWIPGPAPIEDVGTETGYAVAFVRAQDVGMLQVVVDADAAPGPGTPGSVRSVTVGEDTIDVFTPEPGSAA